MNQWQHFNVVNFVLYSIFFQRLTDSPTWTWNRQERLFAVWYLPCVEEIKSTQTMSLNFASVQWILTFKMSNLQSTMTKWFHSGVLCRNFSLKCGPVMFRALWVNLLADPDLFEAKLSFTRHVVVSIVANCMHTNYQYTLYHQLFYQELIENFQLRLSVCNPGVKQVKLY